MAAIWSGNGAVAPLILMNLTDQTR